MIKRGNPVKRKEQIDKSPRNDDLLIDSGSTMLNLCCTDRIEGAWVTGTIVTIPGGTDSGKTMLVLTTLACAASNPKLNGYRLIYDDSESKMHIDIKKMYGHGLCNRLESPPFGNSSSIQNFELNTYKAMRETSGPCIYVLDTPDTLTSDEETEKAHKKLLKMAKSPDDLRNISGSYHTEKAKMMHQILRELNDSITKTGSLLIMLQQIKQKIGVSFGKKTTTSGGNAPGHFSTHIVWINKEDKIKKDNEVVGRNATAQVEKNHYTGKLRSARFPIYYDIGVDDIGSMVDWLVEGYWKKKSGRIIADDLDMDGNRAKIIKSVEEDNLEDDLKQVVQKYWNQKEESLKLNRKRRF